MVLRVELEKQEWDQVLNILADAPWRVSNPLLMKIGDQLNRMSQPLGPQGVGQGELRGRTPPSGDGALKEVQS